MRPPFLQSVNNDEHTNVFVHPEGHHQDLIDTEEGTTPTERYGCFDPSVNTASEDYDIGQDLGVARQRVANEILPNNELDNEKYLQSVGILNPEQKTFFYHILHKVKTGAVPFHTCLSGGAGVGKKCAYQGCLPSTC